MNNKITENDYLEMAEDCKNRIESKDKEILKYKNLYIEEKKKLGTIYGIIKSLQRYLEDCSPDVAFDPIAEHLINDIRSICSDTLFKEEIDKLELVEDIRIVIESIDLN